MKPSTEADLADLKDIFEELIPKLDKMSLKDKVDLAARLKPIAKACESIDKAVKEVVKDHLMEEEGTVNGNLFKAVLTIVPIDRLQQTMLKEARPAIYAQYVKTDEDKRISYVLR